MHAKPEFASVIVDSVNAMQRRSLLGRGSTFVVLCVAVGMSLAACGTPEPSGPDIEADKKIVRDKCHELAADELRDPESAQFGRDELVVATTAFNTVEGQPVAVSAYLLAGTVNGRNGFGGMGDPSAYLCRAHFNESGEIISERTGVEISSITNLDYYLSEYLPNNSIESE